MLDENLPTFFVRRSNDKPQCHSTLFYLKGGEEAQPSYSLRHLDPASPASRNRYAIGIYDPFIPDVLYGETLLIPKWTQPSLSQEAIRANGGVPPPPEPVLPSEFTIQLYNPEQQVLVRHKPGSWNTAAAWEFEMPQQTFRLPSTSTLDRTLSDPAASDVTPKLRFNWRKDGKLSKDLGCYLSGKTTVMDGERHRSKEPDITIAIFKGLKEITLYEPNFYRVEMEDLKGLEIVLMLGAMVIRDVYFGNIKECFHITDPPKPGSPPVVTSGGPFRPPTVALVNPPQSRPHPNQQYGIPPQHPQQKLPVNQPPRREPQPPPADPRTQWEIDAETRRLKQQAEVEARERRKREKELEKRTKKLLEEEKKEAKRRQAQVEQETERLKKLYGKEDAEFRQRQQQQQQQQQWHSHKPPPQPTITVRPPLPTRPHAQSHPAPPHHHRHSSYAGSSPFVGIFGPSSTSERPPAVQPSAHLMPPRPQSTVMGGSGHLSPQQPQPLKERKSIFNLFKKEEQRPNTLTRKRSSMF